MSSGVIKLELSSVLEERHSLTVFPAVVTEILRKIDDPDTTPVMFQETIIKDPLLTAKTLKLANSAFYGYPRAITTISDAVVILGLDTLRNLIIAISAYNVLNKEVKGYHYEKEDFWKHCLSTAMLCRSIADLYKMPNTETFFVAGILHDIGKLLLDRYRFSYYNSIIEFSQQYKTPLYLAEKAVLGINHSEVGGGLAEIWGFPQVLVEVIRRHHEPLSSSPNVLNFAKVTHIADILSNKMLGFFVEKPVSAVWKEFSITEEKELLSEISEKLNSFMKEIGKE